MTREVTDVLLRQLKNPFDPRFVKWRVGATNKEKTKGIALAYIDSREVQKRLDDVVGAGGWQDRYIPVEKGFICELDLYIDGRWVTKSNTAGYTNVDPIKGGGSDSFKRAASAWGVGRYLYYLPNEWVTIKEQGKSYVLAEIPELPEWAKPNSKIERWEDIAEMAADLNSGEDSLDVDTLVDNIDGIRAAMSIEMLDKVIGSLPPDDRVLLANQISAKRRELLHAATINADNSGSSAA